MKRYPYSVGYIGARLQKVSQKHEINRMLDGFTKTVVGIAKV